MKPVLFHLGGVPVYAYSVFIVVGYIFCLGYAVWVSKKNGQDPIHAIDASVWMFVGGFLGARLLYAIVSWRMFVENPLELFKLWNGGFVYYGGFFGGMIGGFLLIRRRQLDFWYFTDLFSPAAIICLIFGRIGCLLNGCCYGTFAPDLPWAITYPPGHPGLGLAQVPVHPSPIYESIACAVISLFLIWRLPRKKFPGEIFGLMAALYSVTRFAVEFFRADPRGHLAALHLSTSQVFAVVTFVAAMAFLVTGWKRGHVFGPTGAAGPPAEAIS